MFAIAAAAVFGSLLGSIFQVRLLLFLWATPLVGVLLGAVMFVAPHLLDDAAVHPMAKMIIGQAADPALIVPMLVAAAVGALLASFMANRLRAGLTPVYSDAPKRRPGWRAAMEAEEAARAGLDQAALMRRAAQISSKSPRQSALDWAAMDLPVLEIAPNPGAAARPDGAASPGTATKLRSETWSDDQPERRVRSRRRSALRGCLCFPGGRAANCTIQNLSVGGCRIRLKEDGQLPMAVVLLDFSNRLAHEAQVTWQEGETAGLEFSASYDIANPRDQRGHELKRLYDEAAAGQER